MNECIEYGWVSSAGKWVERFEEKLSEITGAKYVIAVSNGTVALRLALYLLGVRNNDEVLLSTNLIIHVSEMVSKGEKFSDFSFQVASNALRSRAALRESDQSSRKV